MCLRSWPISDGARDEGERTSGLSGRNCVAGHPGQGNLHFKKEGLILDTKEGTFIQGLLARCVNSFCGIYSPTGGSSQDDGGVRSLGGGRRGSEAQEARCGSAKALPSSSRPPRLTPPRSGLRVGGGGWANVSSSSQPRN